MTIRIAVWSSPRNVSTAMMYAWRQRPDTVVFDEPLYAHYLAVTGVEHPGRNQTLASQNHDGEAVVRDVVLGAHGRPIAFFKMMAKHLVGLDRSVLDRCRNVLLTRDPWEMLTSFQKEVPHATLAETGLEEMIEILDRTLANDRAPIVIDARTLLGDPARILALLCQHLGVEFDEAMLSWPAGPKPEDGVWAPHWYRSVHQSTGWGPWRPKDDTLRPELEPVLEAATPLYERLQRYALR